MNLSLKHAAYLTFFLTVATVLAAWGFELIGGYRPCPLCLQQRWPYYFAIPVLALIVLRVLNEDGDFDVIRWGFIAVVIVMTGGAVAGAYHAGVEWGWWQGPAACSAGAGLSGGLPDLSTAQAIDCSQAQWRFLGLSFAGWNVVMSLLIAGLSLVGARRAAVQGSSSVSQ